MSVILATAGYDHKIRFWEAPSGVCSRVIKYPDSQVNRLQITPDKQFIAAAGNPHIRLYEILSSSADTNAGGPGATVDTAPTQQPVLTLEGHTAAVTSIGFQKDGRYLYSGSEDGTIKVWDLRNPNYSRSFDSKGGVNSVTLRTDRDEFISGDQNGFVKVWDLGGNGCIHSIKPSAAAAATRSKTAGGAGHRRRMAQSAYHEGTVPIQAVDISDDSRTVVACSNRGTVFVWSTNRQDEENQQFLPGSQQQQHPHYHPHHNNPYATHHPHNRYAPHLHSRYNPPPSTSAELLSQPIYRQFRAHYGTTPGTYCLHGKMAPDSRHFVTTGSDGLAQLWDTTTWELSQTLRCQDASGKTSCWVWDGAFCADSSYLVTASSDHISRLWNLRTGDVVRQYHGHQSAVTCVALNDSSV